MTSVDTNIVVRLLTKDDAKQHTAAKSLFAAGPIWVAKTVLLETEWVLRRSYGFEPSSILAAFDRLIGLENVSVEDKPAVAGALALVAHGIDFADALHLASRPAGVMFLSFDRSFVRRAKRAGVDKIGEAPDRKAFS
jgi:predicted nucleic-acid-binding protein